jgi:hypothetical protein
MHKGLPAQAGSPLCIRIEPFPDSQSVTQAPLFWRKLGVVTVADFRLARLFFC